ncbi:unnamed protein product, partial [Didymodactylos carnosus]
YVVDCLNYRIQMFCSPDSLEGITIAGTTGKGGNAANQLYIPESITFDSQMNMYVADSGNHRIQKFQRIL